MRRGFETGIEAGTLPALTRVSRLLDDILNRVPDRQAPYVGASAFTHKAGLHASAILKDPATYEHVPPEAVGNARVDPDVEPGRASRTCASGWRRPGSRCGPATRGSRRSSPRSRRARTAAMPTTARRRASSCWRATMLGVLPRFFEVERYRVTVERRRDARGEPVTRLGGGGGGALRRRAGDERLREPRPGDPGRPGPGQRAVARAQEGSRAVPGLHRRHAAGRLPGADHQRRHRGGDAGDDRERRPRGAALVDGRGLGEHRRRELPGAHDAIVWKLVRDGAAPVG